MPLDRKPHPDGNVTTDDNGLVEVIQDPAERDRLRRHHGARFYRPHFATCPNADQHRRRRG
jgi:hypothetical protein